MPAGFVGALPIAIFGIAMALEWWFARRRALRVYEGADTLSNLSCGLGSLITGIGFAALAFHAYTDWVFQRAVLLSWESAPAWLRWTLLFLLIDLAYYCFHRVAHRVELLWAGHAVHHQSDQMNLSVALRQSWFVGAFSWVFYYPLVYLGFGAGEMMAMRGINTLGQFWFHTRMLGRLGWLELWLNTPSHHRVHHGVDEAYIDRNYGGVLIVWDRLFGTFEPEAQEPTYGTRVPFRSTNAWWANLEPWVAAARAGSLGFWERWFGPPELKKPHPDAATQRGGLGSARGTQWCLLLLVLAAFIFASALEDESWNQGISLALLLAALGFLGRSLDLSNNRP